MARRRHFTGDTIVEQFHELRSDYDASKKTRFKRRRVGIQPTGSHADYHYRTWHAYAGIMETARDLFRNHALIGQGIRRLISNVLRGGFVLDVKTGDDSIDNDLESRWNAWAGDPDACDRQGELSFHALEKLVLQHTVVDGDVLTLPTRDGSLQLVEGHRLRTPNNTKRNVVHGVLLDEFRKRQQYWVTRDDISVFGALTKVGDVTQYPARVFDEMTQRDERAVLHHYMPDRITQTRGLTALAPVIDTAGMGDDLMFAQLVKAQMAACVTILRELAADVTLPPALGGDSNNSGLDVTTETRPNGTTRQITGWQPGMEMFGFPGESLKGFSPNTPNAEFFQHATLILSIVAVNLDLPVAVFMLDPSNTNFSGWRGAMDQARERFQDIQRWQIGSFHSPVYRWKVRQWASEDPTLRRALGVEGIDLFGHQWHAQEWPYIEPVKDGMGDVLQERNLLNSSRRLKARRGLNFWTVTDEIAEERAYQIKQFHETAERLNKELGLQLTWKDIAHWPMPEGVTISVGDPPPQSGGNGDGGADADLPEILKQRMNGHAH